LALALSSFSEHVPHRGGALSWSPDAPGDVLRWPLPALAIGDRWLMRGISLFGWRQVLSISGLAHVQAARDPFIVALNHNNRSEALLVPTLMMLHRGGKLIRFLADWNYGLIPGIGLIYRRAGILMLTRKPAQPRLLNALKPLYRHRQSVLVRAQQHLCQGNSIGLFPEGAINRNPDSLLEGRRGAAWLSLTTGAPVVPVGIRFPQAETGRPIADLDRIAVRIGSPLAPPRAPASRVPLPETRAFHAAIMREIARLSGKRWNSNAEELHHA
jgi:1-acyl-sn-glycerol-3-phosphate acyltransferase